MNCRKCERKLSDLMDGRLSGEAARDLEAHLADCPSCRAYRMRLERLQRGAASGHPPVPDGGWDGFSARVRARLESAAAAERPSPARRPGWRLVWVAAPAAAAAALIGFLIFRPSSPPISELLAYEEGLASFGQAAAEDAELAGELNAVVLGAIQEETGGLSLDEMPAFADDPGFWQGLSDEEVSFLDREIAKDLTS